MSHVLLIEDNQANADMIIHVLRTAGFTVKHFLNGMDGAKSAREARPSVILMDFNLPDADGQTLSLLLRQQLRVPIIACTARIGDAEIQKAAKFGCSAVLTKPFTPEELLAAVNRILSRSTSSEQT